MTMPLLALSRHTITRLALSFLLLGLALGASAAAPESIRLSYDVYSHGMKLGRIDEEFARNGNRYTLSSTSTPEGLMAMFKPGKVFMHSKGLVAERGLRPDSFSHTRENDQDGNRAEFDWSRNELAISSGGQRQNLALPPGTQDRLSAMYQFMFLAMEQARSVDFPMTNGRKLDDYHYAVEPGNKVDTPLGPLDALYLDSQSKPGENRTEIWLATRYRHLPCKMIITEGNGDQFIQVLSSIEIRP